MKRDLRELPVPDHRDGFWDDLAAGLVDEVQELPVAGDDRRFPGWLLAPAAAVVVLVAAIGVSGLVGGIGDQAEDDSDLTGDGPPTTSVAAETTTTAAADTTDSTAATASTLYQSPPDAPWAVPGPVAVDTVADVLVEEWNAADNRTWCSALAITGDSLTNDGYIPRAAEFSGGWAVAYDSPDLRSAFGVAGTGMVRDAELPARWPKTVTYVDGSMLGYGGEGFDESNSRRLGEIVVAGQGCLYQVWSELGDEHLIQVVESLRFVEGLQADPVELVETEVRDGGPAPWTGAAVDVDLPAVVEQNRPVEGPLLWPTTVGFDDAALRPANLGEWGVAWDVRGQPGHDSFNLPCAECGRGVVGFAEFEPAVGVSAPSGRQLRIEYDDGSYVEVGYYVGDDRLPPDRPQFTTVDTGEQAVGGYQASIFLEDGRQYLLWSHLGLDHLLALVDGLRGVG